MAYFVAALSCWLILSAATALRPGRRGIFAALAYPVGWAAGELPAQAIAAEAGLLGLLWWWGWPKTHWLSVLVGALAAIVMVENFFLIIISLYSVRLVRRQMASAPLLPLEIPKMREDKFGSWWRTALQIPYHPLHMQLHRNIPYGPHHRNRLDIWRTSTTPKGAPVLFYVHGGSWVFGDKREQGRPMMHEFVARGWVCVTLNYRLAPKDLMPAQVEDVTRALGWIKKNIASYGGDPQRIVISGGSAGGHLAALVALQENDDTFRPSEVRDIDDWSVRGAIPFYGVLEMTGDESLWNGLGKGLRFLLEKTVVKRRYDDEPEFFERISPHHQIHVGAPPFLVIQGSNDTLVDVNVARGFVAKFREVAVAPLYYVELPFTQHAFDVTASPRTSATTRAAVAFAESVVRGTPSSSRALYDAYQVPPAVLEIEVAPGEWVAASEAAPLLGDFYVVTSDNPYGELESEDENLTRRAQFEQSLRERGVVSRRSRGRDAKGMWPDEYGLALAGVTLEFALATAKTWRQNALYFVGGSSVEVIPTSKHTLSNKFS